MENWRGKRVVFSPNDTGGFHDLESPQIKGKEVSSQAMGRTECMVSDMKNVTRLARGVHGVMKKSVSLINPAPDDGIAKPNDICKVSGQASGPCVGLFEDMSFDLLGFSQPVLEEGPGLNNCKISTHIPTSLVPKSPSCGPGLITNDIGQGSEAIISKAASFTTSKWRRIDQSNREESTGEKFGEESGKRRNDEIHEENSKRSRKISSQSIEDRVFSFGISQTNSQLLEGMGSIGVCNVGNCVVMVLKCVEGVSLVDSELSDGMCEANQECVRAVTQSENFLVDYDRHTQGKKHLISTGPLCVVNWIPPDRGKFKMNCAVSVNSRSKRIGIGVIVKDSDGEVLACYSQRVEANMSNKEANLIAILKGLHFGVDCGLSPQVIELDDKDVIDWINSGSHVDSAFGAILMDINMLMEDMDGLVFQYVSKLANKAAQGLSDIAFNISEDTFWMEEFPICICRVIDSEKPV
ncbi:hypothetical protein LWI29_020929 [Acer saccharum]|uniref:RNase H type-1 domain-containing protein n=1 Tax=Acer saccharum TaxID=4024 RepID=A0AA39RIC4_ACESA|nr:hypothetical protein LWI29_020929 [Acer saccharum]